MSLFQDSLASASEATAIQGGDISFGTKAGGVLAGAIYSGLHSLYNTAAAGANALGANIEEANTYESLRNLDENWANYYKENQNAIDIAGFIATSLVPGTLAVKGLNALRAGESVGAFGRALNFAPNQQKKYLAAALKELSQEGGSVFTRINRNKVGVLSWEFADQALQASVFELAVAITMNQSPLLADDDWWSIGKGIATGALLGGAIGGGIVSLGINKGFKDAVRTLDQRTTGYQSLSGLKNTSLAEGDKAFGLIDSLLKLPEDVLAKDELMDVAFRLGSGPVKQTVNVSKVLSNALKQSTTSAMNEFELTLRKLAAGSDAGAGGTQPETAEALARFVLGRFKGLKDAGAKPSQIREELGDYLWNLKKVSAATEEPKVTASDLFYFKGTITPEDLAKVQTAGDWQAITTRTTPFGKRPVGAYDKPYIFLGSPAQLSQQRIALVGSAGEDGVIGLSQAWEAGYQMAKMPDGALRVNPQSGLWKQVTDPVYDPKRFLNTRTGAVTEDAVLTAADRMLPGKKMRVLPDSVLLETKDGVSKVNMLKAPPVAPSVGYATARHAWAAELADDAIPTTVNVSDISLLERVVDAPPAIRQEITLVKSDGTTVNGNLAEALLLRTKVDGLQEAFAAGTHDVRELALRFATTEDWVSQVVGSEFGTALKNFDDLKAGMRRELKSFAERENVVVHYDTPWQFTATDAAFDKLDFAAKRKLILEQATNNGGQFVTGELAYAYRVQQAIRATKDAGYSVLGADKAGLLVDLSQDAAKMADSLGAGASFLGASNASYGETLKLAAQHSGKLVHGWIQEASNKIVGALATPSAKILENKAAAAELGIVTNILRNEAGKYVRTLDDADPTSAGTLLLTDLAKISDLAKRAEKEELMKSSGIRTRIEIKEADTMEFLDTHVRFNKVRVEKQTVLNTAKGFTTNRNPDVYYAPPIDTNYFQHFAFVKGIEGKAFGTSEVAMIFGRDAAELQQRMALVDRTQFDVITKDGSERYYKAKGQYDFDQTINERTIDSELRRTGALANFFPETRAQNLVEDYLRFGQNQEAKLIRNSVESIYSQQFEELRALGRGYTEDATSKFSGTLRAAKSEITNPYEDFIKTALDVSKRSEYTFFHQANEFVDALGTRAYRMLADVTGKAQKGLVPWQEVNEIAERHGIKGMYSSEADYFLSNAPRDRNLIKEYVAKANTLLANLVLRFDFAQSLMNVVSTPLLLSTELASIRTLAAQDSKLTGSLNELLRVAVPGTQGAATIPSTLRLQANAIRNFFGPEKQALLQRYKENGDIKDVLSLYHSAIDDLGMSPNFQAFSDGANRAADKVAKLTLNNWSEEFTRFVSADVMRQLTEPLVNGGKLSLQEANAYISTFVNRVQGNYISSQRPVVFQGVLGGAIGLFQTYSFNLLQQLLRHVENRDLRAVATMYGMQAGLFGLNGTPLFDAVNTHLIGNAAVNQGHYDAYSVAPGLLGKEWGDWLMYGTVSAFPAFSDKWPSLYTRGDINPRHMTILPMMPQDVPAVDAAIRVVGNLSTIGKKLIGGADISETLLQGLEHNGINRPIAGFAQVLQGHSTTSRGAIISANSDMDLITNASRILGSKPMDESIALNNMYRLKAYQAADRQRMEALGQVVKTELLRNEYPGDEQLTQFMTDYAKIGGRVENFNGVLQNWSRDANTSVVERMRTNLNSTTGQRLSEIMGGGLQDYRNNAVQPGELTP